jgi:hypothetical protein
MPPAWPADPGHREAIETLLLMAGSEYRWGNAQRAVDLLDNVEQIMGRLPEPYALIRSRCRGHDGGPLRL